jgi:hypothetical protein
MERMSDPSWSPVNSPRANVGPEGLGKGSSMENLPTPGLDGSYRGGCVVCLRGTDTGLVFYGEPEWAVAGLCVLGVPEDQASTVVIHAIGDPVNETVPDGVVACPVKVCAGCAESSPWTPGVVPVGAPVISPAAR